MTTHPLHTSQTTIPPLPGTGDWTGLLKMAPAALELVSPRHLAHQGIELLYNAANGRRFLSVLTDLQTQLREARVPVIIDQSRGAPPLLPVDRLSRPQRRWLGQVALELYFTQILRGDVAIVDLWPSHFGVDASGEAIWSPRPFYVQWDPAFRDGLREVYAGFFLEKPERLRDGLGRLGLSASAGPLLEHLGEGNQRSVRFDRDRLDSTLQAMARLRGPEHPALHRNFAAFGLYLTSLHELLGSLNLAFDVRSAFMRSRVQP
jgi:hypothetical protein